MSAPLTPAVAVAAATAPAIPSTPSPARADLLAALARAKAERLIVLAGPMAGCWKPARVAADGAIVETDYTIVETGPEPHQVRCDCADATFRERLCKHAVCAVMARTYGVRPVMPLRDLRTGLLERPTPIRRCANCRTDPAAHGSVNCAGCDHVLDAEKAIAADRRHAARERAALQDAAGFRPLRMGHGWN